MFRCLKKVDSTNRFVLVLGDAMYKPYVTALPELATVDLDGDEDFVVVACDGLWDYVSEDDVALAVYRQLAADPGQSQSIKFKMWYLGISTRIFRLMTVREMWP